MVIQRIKIGVVLVVYKMTRHVHILTIMFQISLTNGDMEKQHMLCQYIENVIKTNYENYWQISLTCTCCKLLVYVETQLYYDTYI
jgi:hypothetical protein